MSLISYAQNFEDIMLWRALKHIQNGCYIDIGAQDPLIDSVSKVFYAQGWRGIHVEPTQQYADKLRQERPDELVMQVAVSSQPGSIVFYEFADTGLSTANRDIALRHQTAGLSCTETQVQLITLDEVFNQVATQDIHWLKIDVEGLEKSVLESWGSNHIRPWILVIESTKPTTQEESYQEWEFLVLQKGYQFAYFDGLNRFYISGEHLELVDFFKISPNIFDGFALSGYASHPFGAFLNSQISELNVLLQQAEARAEQAEARAEQAEARAEQAEARAEQAEARAEHAGHFSSIYEAQLKAITASTSWRITYPIRRLRTFFVK